MNKSSVGRSFAFLIAAVGLTACQRNAPANSVDIVRGCSTRVRSKGAAVRLPVAPALRPGFGGIIGTLADAGGALPHYPVLAVIPGGETSSTHASAIPDSSGGFAFDALRPGHYRLFVRAYSHRRDSTDVEVRAAQIDTVAIVMQLYDCLGR
ncbi:MAG: carboxypeptidase-like regulatory domain-containing protein [Gemmatimonadaceae bacterium]